jgi:hypothetical protein
MVQVITGAGKNLLTVQAHGFGASKVVGRKVSRTRERLIAVFAGALVLRRAPSFPRGAALHVQITTALSCELLLTVVACVLDLVRVFFACSLVPCATTGSSVLMSTIHTSELLGTLALVVSATTGSGECPGTVSAVVRRGGRVGAFGDAFRCWGFVLGGRWG